MDTTVLPNKTATTNPPLDTHVPALYSLDDGYLLYRPDENSFIALYPDEFLPLRTEGENNNRAIAELQEANQAVTEKSLALAELRRKPDPLLDDLQKAEVELDQALSTLDAKSKAAKERIEKIADLKTDQKKLVEVLPLTMQRDTKQKAFYIPAEKLKAAAADKRVYLVEGKVERNKPPAGKLFDGAKLNGAEVKRRIAEQAIDKAKFSRKWKLKPKDGDEYAGQFFSEWSKTMGASAQQFLEREQKAIIEGIFGTAHSKPDDPHRMIDMKSEAQLMRWAGGAGLEANFLPFQGNLYDARDKDFPSRFKRAAKAAQFNIKANAEALFAVGEAKVQTTVYYPHFAGWHLEAALEGLPLNMGFFRLRGDMTLYGVAGASLALEASAALMITGGKQGLRGIPPEDRDKKAVKAKVGAGAKVELFAGLKEGAELRGAFQWLNPEGFTDAKSPQRKDPHKAWGEYVDMATVSEDAALVQGLAASLGIEVDYKDGNFVIALQGAAALGLGGSAKFSGKVGAATIGQFVMCMAHQFKQADYTKLTALMRPGIFKAYNEVLVMVTIGEHKLEEFARGVATEIDNINDLYQAALARIRFHPADFIRKLELQMKSRWGWYSYLPPEGRGALVACLANAMADPDCAGDHQLQQFAAFSVNELLATTQSQGHIDNMLDRITVNIGDVPGRAAGVTKIDSILAYTQFAGGVIRAEAKLADANVLFQRPFMRNDGPEFVMAKFDTSHPSGQA